MRKKIINKINNYFGAVNSEELLKIGELLAEKTSRLNIRYFSDSGGSRDIKLVLRPWLIKPHELDFFHRLIYAFKGATRTLCGLYLRNDAIRGIMPLSQDEQEWFSLINKDKFQAYQTVFGRWDTNVSFDERARIKDIKFLETNTVGIGGTHYIPAVSQAIRDVLKISFERKIYPYRLSFQPDPRKLLSQEIKAHARLIGRKSLNVAFVENSEYLGGTVELPELSRYFMNLGINAVLADPRDLRLKKRQLYYRDIQIDIIYRDSELQELIDIEKKGHNMKVLKHAFMNNQVISSIAGELDHKSSFEIFTNPDFSRYFTISQRMIFRKYLPWTRLISQRNTTDSSLRVIDLVPYITKNKDLLIIKPNREYGGKGVSIGRILTREEWNSRINRALNKPGGYVVQDFVEIRKETFPVFNQNKGIEFDEFYSVSGFVVTRNAISVLGRFSKDIVVNVARKGGIIPALLLSKAS